MVGEIATDELPEHKKELFESLVSDPLILFQAVLDNPEAYEEGLSDLLIEVINKRRKVEELSRSQRDLLNRAVVDFATQSKPARKAEAHRPAYLPEAARAALGELEEEGWEPELPFEPNEFWWARTEE